MRLFEVLIGFQIMTINANNYFVWKDRLGRDVSVDVNNLFSMNSVLRSTGMEHCDPGAWIAGAHFVEYHCVFLVYCIFMIYVYIDQT